MSEKAPKVFISYSWTPDDRVEDLAKRLVGDGVDVVFDKWELQAGQDKYAFMERSVTDSSINKVLMICDKAYAEKANDRKGGVGDETTVISPEIYAQATETKYIPIIFERDENGEEYTPVYLKSRIYFDLCADNYQYEQEYEKLLRNLHNKPEHRKPALGKMPEWLNEENVDLSSVRNLLKQVQFYDGKNRSKIDFAVRKFNDEFAKTMLSYAPTKDDDFSQNLRTQIDAEKPLRDLFFDYLEALLTVDVDVSSVIGNFFEQTFNDTYVLEAGRREWDTDESVFQTFLIWEMFVGTVTILLYYERYAELNAILHRTYFLREFPVFNTEPATFMQFFPHVWLHNAGDIVAQREKLPIITKATLANADLILYQLSCVFEFSKDIVHDTWQPTFYIDEIRYDQPLWSRMVSVKHCEKLFPLFGVSDLAQLKTMVSKILTKSRESHPNVRSYAAFISRNIDLEKIGTLP